MWNKDVDTEMTHQAHLLVFICSSSVTAPHTDRVVKLHRFHCFEEMALAPGGVMTHVTLSKIFSSQQQCVVYEFSPWILHGNVSDGCVANLILYITSYEQFLIFYCNKSV